MKVLFLPLAALLVAASAPASDDLITQATADVSSALKTPLSVTVDEQVALMSLSGDRLTISPQTAALVKTREEARALIVLALAYQPATSGTAARKPGAAEYIIALPLYLASQGAADRQQYANGGTYPVEWSQPAGPDTDVLRENRKAAREQRGARALHLLQQSGGCSGPLVDLLNRMRAEDHGSNAASAASNAGFAKVALTDLGRNVYPPDRACE